MKLVANLFFSSIHKKHIKYNCEISPTLHSFIYLKNNNSSNSFNVINLNDSMTNGFIIFLIK